MFLTCLADSFGLGVDFNEDGSVRLSLSPPVSEENIDYIVPNVIEVQQDGTIRPVNYELRDEKEDSVL
jgi:hypothetical protein